MAYRFDVFTRKRIKRYYGRLISRAEFFFAKDFYEQSIEEARNAANFAYGFNLFLTDRAMESLVALLSDKILSNEPHGFVPDNRRIVFYDGFGLDNKVLAQQYIRAIGTSDYKCLYVYEQMNEKDGREVIRELESYSNITVCCLEESLTPIERIKKAYNAICIYKPLKLFTQVYPWSVEAAIVARKLKQGDVTIYNINLQDHAYWVGASVVDYSIEFRHYGASLSVQIRGLRSEQLIMLPYYPVMRSEKFQGFPSKTEGKVILFSGGAPYKIYGEGGEFFQLVKRLLDENLNVIFLFACGGDTRKIEEFIKRNNFHDRFVLIGHRRDICQVYEHCDVFLSTYPFFGGLMSQYAAVYGKPILAYTHPKFECNNIEEFVCHTRQEHITYTNREAFFDYAHRVFSNREYREAEGQKLKGCIVNQEQFNAEFQNLLAENRTSFPINHDRALGWDVVCDNYLEIENRYHDYMYPMLLLRYGVKSLYLFPFLVIGRLPNIIQKIIAKLQK